MGFDIVKQRVVNVFHQTKETTVETKNDMVDKPIENFDHSEEITQKPKQAITHSAEKIDTATQEAPRRTVQVIDGITARVKKY